MNKGHDLVARAPPLIKATAGTNALGIPTGKHYRSVRLWTGEMIQIASNRRRAGGKLVGACLRMEPASRSKMELGRYSRPVYGRRASIRRRTHGHERTIRYPRA